MSKITITTIQIIPFLVYGKDETKRWNADAEWLRHTINMLYNRNKAAFHAAGALTDVFHNHNERLQQTIVRYPLVQYQVRADGLFAVGINEGGEALTLLSELYNQAVRLTPDVYLEIKLVRQSDCNVSAVEKPIRYRLTGYLPFSSEAYKTYGNLHYMNEKTDAIADRIGNHIFKDFVKHLNLSVSETKVEVVDVESFNRKKVTVQVNKNAREFKPFDVVFDAAIDLPSGICLGNEKTYGYGLLHRPD